MNKMGEKMFLKYFFLLILYKDIFYYHHQFKTNVIRLYDYFIIGGLLSQGGFCPVPIVGTYISTSIRKPNACSEVS